jgi:molybdate/tungstate transport system ATP-binding protein
MISLEHVSARVGSFELNDISFEVPNAGYGVVIGPAGSGKTTLLETIAGVLATTSGRIRIDGSDVTRAPPEARRLGIVYQHAYLFPHLSVRDNVEYGAVSKAVANDIGQRFEIREFEGRSVTSLSGGERQLVAMARALARRPAVVLLDEPFSALDPRTRNTMRRVVRAIHREWRFTALQVTHDFAEAGLLGEVAIVLDRGRVVQQGEPEFVFRKPATPYIADFLGAENVFRGVVRSAHEDAGARLAGREDEFGKRAVEFTTGNLMLYGVGDVADGTVHAVIRAEEISLSLESSASSVKNQFRGRIVEIVPGGALTRVTVDVNGTPIVAAVTTRSARELSLALGNSVVAAFKATAIHFC